MSDRTVNVLQALDEGRHTRLELRESVRASTEKHEPLTASHGRAASVTASVCIAAHNEADGIETAVRSALVQRLGGTLEVLICVNGCSDATAEVARMIAREDPRVQVFETSVRGKPNAWNILREHASGRVLYFMDADVFVVQGAFESLARALASEPRMVAVGARCIPVNLNGDRLSRVTAPPPGPITCLNGGLYAVDARRLSVRFRERGVTRMPCDIICEDLWLTMVIGKRRWAEVSPASVLYVLPRFKERVLTERRIRWGLRQLRREYRSLHRELGRTYLNRLRAWLVRAVHSGSLSNVLRMIAVTVMFRLVVLCTMGTSPRGPWLRKWRSAPSSKRLVPLLPAYAAMPRAKNAVASDSGRRSGNPGRSFSHRRRSAAS